MTTTTTFSWVVTQLTLIQLNYIFGVHGKYYIISLEDAVLAGKCNKKPDQSVPETLSVQSVSICENYFKDFCFTAGIFGKAGQFIIVYTLKTRIGSLTQG